MAEGQPPARPPARAPREGPVAAPSVPGLNETCKYCHLTISRVNTDARQGSPSSQPSGLNSSLNSASMPGGCGKASPQRVLPTPGVSDNPQGMHPRARGQAECHLSPCPGRAPRPLSLLCMPQRPLVPPQQRHGPLSSFPRTGSRPTYNTVKIFRKLTDSRKESQNRNKKLKPWR